MFLVWVLGTILGFLISHGMVSARTGRWIGTIACALTAIPAGFALGWLFAVGATLLVSIVIYNIFLGVERVGKNT
jgi:hypothetical protein